MKRTVEILKYNGAFTLLRRAEGDADDALFTLGSLPQTTSPAAAQARTIDVYRVVTLSYRNREQFIAWRIG